MHHVAQMVKINCSKKNSNSTNKRMKLRVTNDDNLMRQHSVSRRKIANQSDVSKGTYALEALLTHTRIWKQQKSQESSRLVWSLSLATLTQHHFICMHQCCTLSIFPITSSFFQSSRKQRIASNLAFVLLRIRNKLARFQFMLHTFGHGQTTVLVGALTSALFSCQLNHLYVSV